MRFRERYLLGTLRASCLAMGILFSQGCGGGGKEATEETTNNDPQAPVISSFAATPSSIHTPEDVSLAWTVSGATSLRLDPGGHTVSGSGTTVRVEGTTTYTLTATGAGGATATRTTTVTLLAPGQVRIIFLHHSTGANVWGGGVSAAFTSYNQLNGTQYQITDRYYPDTPYPWENYPYDYWNLWVNPNGPTDDANPKVHSLEKLCADYDVIVFKHCYPVSDVLADTGSPSVSSKTKRAENYRLQYAALKTRLRQFPGKKFILWTGAARAAGQSTAGNGQRARAFFQWVKDTWDTPGDNIFLWDFFELETEGGDFLRTEYTSSGDSHPNATFCKQVGPLFAQRVIDVIEGRGDTGSLTGE